MFMMIDVSVVTEPPTGKTTSTYSNSPSYGKRQILLYSQWRANVN